MSWYQLNEPAISNSFSGELDEEHDSKETIMNYPSKVYPEIVERIDEKYEEN